jgi:predicted DNA-binding protein (MmcQ/YjbR family)
MDIETIRNYCLSKKGVTEGFPFDQDTLVFKVMGKMFLLTSLSENNTINVKCEPEYAMELRENYDAVKPGYHMNKKFWNTVDINSGLDNTFIMSLIDHSYNQVVEGFSKKMRAELEAL